MGNAMANIPEAERFLTLLWPDGGPDGAYLVLSRVDGGLISTWTTLPDIPSTLVPWLTEYAPQYNTYYGVGLRNPKLNPSSEKRGGKESVYALPGFVFDADDLRGRHKQPALPANEHETIAFAHTLPWRPSLIVDSGGGTHLYWLFGESLLYIQAQAKERHGWQFDKLAQLDIILRLPGSINHKTGTPIPVTMLHESGVRYTADDIERALPPPSHPKRRPQRHTTTSQRTAASTESTCNLDIMTVARHYGAELTLKSQQSGEWEGAHPQHDSTTGTNFNIEPNKGVWHCFRCDSGGDALSLIAVCEQLIPCEDARSCVFKGKLELYRQAITVANQKFGAGIDWHAWLEPEIPDAYEGPEYGDDDLITETAEYEKPVEDTPKASIWDSAERLDVFLQGSSEIPEGLVSDIAYPGGITTVAAPAGAGKSVTVSILAYSLADSGVFRNEKLTAARVLLIDTDNPPGLIRYRLKHICERTDIDFSDSDTRPGA